MTEAHVIMDCNVISAINIVDLLPWTMLYYKFGIMLKGFSC